MPNYSEEPTDYLGRLDRMMTDALNDLPNGSGEDANSDSVEDNPNLERVPGTSWVKWVGKKNTQRDKRERCKL